MTNIVVLTLDFKYSSTYYYKRDWGHELYPIYSGNYRLSFTAMTRKTGVLSDFSFAVFVQSHDFSTKYFDKIYTFSNFGTVNITEDITLPSLEIYNRAWIQFYFTGHWADYSLPSGAGITNVRF